MGLVAARGKGVRESKMSEGVKGPKFPAIRYISHGDVICSMVAIVDVIYTCMAYLKTAKRVDLKSTHHKEKKSYNSVW